MGSRRMRRALGALGASMALTGLVAAPALADCSAPVLAQPFSAFKDTHAYALAPGGTFDDDSWQLSGGASIVAAAHAGAALDLPSKAQAVSPPMCITSDYPTARAWVQNVAGAEGVFFYVSYYVNGVWTAPKNTGQFHGSHTDWTLSNPMNVQPGKAPGWQLVKFTFVAGGTTSDFRVDDFWVDPRGRM
jgi:hypothetical protein